MNSNWFDLLRTADEEQAELIRYAIPTAMHLLMRGWNGPGLLFALRSRFYRYGLSEAQAHAAAALASLKLRLRGRWCR